MKIGMIFPGYGSQYVGMAKDVYDESRVMQEYFDQASLCVEINFIKLCFASSEAELAKMQQAYSALFAVSSSLYAALLHEGIEPDVVVGYNVGLYAAMHAAKGLSFADGLYVLKKLTQYAQELLEQERLGMARVKGPSTDELILLLKQIAQDQVSIAVYEMPNQHIITGPENSVDLCVQHLKDMPDVKVEEIPAEFGIHGKYMLPAIDKFKIYLEKVDFKDIAIPMISNVTGLPVQEGAELKQEVIQHFTQPVQWLECLKALHTCDVILSVGPGTLLVEMAKQLYPNKQILPVATLADIAEVKKIIAEKKAEEQPAELVEPEQEHIG
jgi:[acyl-carrier-protein] S-malonyltransferase